MKRIVLLISTLTLAVAAPAAAKGPSEATLSGPGLEHAVTLSPDESGPLVQDSGFFPAAFGQSPDPMLAKAPTKRLGPRYTLVYVVPGPNGGVDQVRQDVYPYANGGPLTYTKSGQPFFDGQKTRGGWYAAPAGFKETLVSLGLPRSTPKTAAGKSSRAAWAIVPIAALLLAAVPLAARRHR